MKDAQFWNPLLYYLMWYGMVAASGIIAFNMMFWEMFVGGFKMRLTSFVKLISFAFFTYNLGLIFLDYGGYLEGYWLWMNRVLSVAVIPFSLAIVMTFINFRSYTTDPAGKNNIVTGFGMIEQEVAMLRREVQRGKAINKEFQENICHPK